MLAWVSVLIYCCVIRIRDTSVTALDDHNLLPPNDRFIFVLHPSLLQKNTLLHVNLVNAATSKAVSLRKRYRRTSQRTATPQETSDKVQRCRCGQVPAVASLVSSSDVEWVTEITSPENKPNMQPIPQSSESHVVSLPLSTHAYGRGQGKRESGKRPLPCRVSVTLRSRQPLP